MEFGPMWERASADACDVPAPKGVKRARRLNPIMLDAVAKMAGEGLVARTGGKAARVLQFALHRRGMWQGCAKATANLALGTRAQRYRDSAAEVFACAPVGALSVAFDASRVGGRDMLLTAMWSGSLQIGCWGDPIVLPEEETRDMIRHA